MTENTTMSFWEHLDVLRGSLIKIIIITTVFTVIAFVAREPLFHIVLSPSRSDFITYKLLGSESFRLNLINTGLTEQFAAHMKTAFSFGLLIASPYIVWVVYHFIAPGLYQNEKRAARKAILSGYCMFIIGVLICYYLLFPLTVRFLGTYSVSSEVQNMLSLQSYIDTFIMMTIVFGVLFEIPVISWIMAQYGLLRHEWMSHYRRHAIVLIVIIAAIITPTTDAFTLLIVSLPIWLLYEASILVVKNTQK